MKEVIITSILKTTFFEGYSWFRFNNLGFEILHKCGKRFETKSEKVLGVNSNVSGSYRGKPGRGGGGGAFYTFLS